MMRATIRKTPTMKLIEHIHGEPIDQLLSRLYEQENKTITEIGGILGVSETAVLRWLERFGIETRRPGPRSKDRDPVPVPVATAAGSKR